MTAAKRERVLRRAKNRCEYCLMPFAQDFGRWHVDHVIAHQHRVNERMSNLAATCAFCNLHKGPNLAGVDPQAGRVVRLFHPRKDRWAVHFRYQNAVLLGRTSIGRATIQVLAINYPSRMQTRASLMEEEKY